jgi:hypothetical protein
LESAADNAPLVTIPEDLMSLQLQAATEFTHDIAEIHLGAI